MNTTHIKKYTAIWLIVLIIVFILVYLFGLTNVKPVSLKPTPIPRELTEQDTLNLLKDMKTVSGSGVKAMSKEDTLALLKATSKGNTATSTLNNKK